jgi:hypothetical protein
MRTHLQGTKKQSSVTAILKEAPYDPLSEADDPLDSAEAAEALGAAESEARAARETVLRDCIDVAQAAQVAGRSRKTLERMRRAGRLLAVHTGRQWLYPRWQFEPTTSNRLLEGFEDVLRRLELSPMGTAFWLLQPSDRLGGRSPLEMLRHNQSGPVLQLAKELSYVP